MSSSNSCENISDDKTERILPDIEDNQEIESLLIRETSRIDNDDNSSVQEVTETVEHMEVTVLEETAEKVNVDNDMDDCKEEEYKSGDDAPIVIESSQSHDVSIEEPKTRSISEPEIEPLNRMLVNVRSEFSRVELSNKLHENEKSSTNNQNDLSNELQKNLEEDESTNVSYHKINSEQQECKIIVTHEDSDISSVASSDSIQEEMKIKNTVTSFYQYKCSQSLPSSPVSKKKFHLSSFFHRSSSRASLLLESERSNENLCAYPMGFEATTLQNYLKDNYNDEDMELEELENQSYTKQNRGMIVERPNIPNTSHSGVSDLKARRSKVPESFASVHTPLSYCQIEEEDSDADSCISCHSDEKDEEEEEDDEDEEEDEEDDEEDEEDGAKIMLVEKTEEYEEKHEPIRIDCKVTGITHTTLQQQQEQSANSRSQSQLAEQYSTAQFSHDHNHSTSHQQHQQQQQHQQKQQQQSQQLPAMSLQQNAYSLSLSEISQNLMNMPVCADPMSSTDSKSYSSSSKSTMQKPSTELLNISEDAHAGPMNVFEFDGLQILVPSTFISESSQKAVSATSQQSMSSSENGAGNDEEVKSVNMRADETMPPRGELSEQESNGCTEQSAWQLYVGQESSRISTSYDLIARESWEESEGSEREDNNGGPLLDSRSLATHFTSSLFLDRDRKTPTRRVFKCSHCSELFDCPKERRVHSAMVHKEAGPSSCNSENAELPYHQQSDLKDIKLLDGRANVFEDIFVPGGLQVQPAYHHQQPQLHQLQPAQHPSSVKVDADQKTDALLLSTVSEVTCTLCGQRFTSEKSLQLHHRRTHVAEPTKRVRENAKCQICNEEFTSVASFNIHLKIHPLECGQCGKYFYRKQNFKLHMKRHLGIKPFSCTICNKAFLTKQKLDEHTNGHTGHAPVKCNLCNETFRRYSNLTQHKNRHHLNIKKKLKDYICHCGEVFHTKKKLAWHKETHDEKPKACTYCNERFIHMASLTRHMRRAHNRRFVPDAQRENENVECPICKCIYLKSSLAVHMRVHNGERPYECQVCSKAFSTKWNLQLHKWTHAARSTKPFKCNQCSAAFYRHSDYTAHMNSHRNVRPYTCNYCGAQFIRKYNCLRHVKEHEENKAYTCDVCNKTFHRSYYLKEHLRVHSGARPYTCHICGKSSSTKSNHNKHVRIHHAREPVNTEN